MGDGRTDPRLIEQQPEHRQHLRQHRCHQADHQEGCQAWYQWPETQADFPQRPHHGGAEEQGQQPGSEGFAPGIQHPGGEQAGAGQQVIPGAAQRDQAQAADGQGQAAEPEQGAEDEQGKASCSRGGCPGVFYGVHS